MKRIISILAVAILAVGSTSAQKKVVEAHTAEIEALKREDSNLQQQISTLKSDKDKLQQQIHKMKATEEEYKQQIERLKSTEEYLRQDINKLRATESELQQQISGLKATESELQKQINELSSTKEEFKQQAADLNSTDDELIKQIEALKKNEESLLQQIVELKASEESAQKQLEALRAYDAQLQNRCDELERTCSMLQSAYKTTNEFIAILSDEVNKLTAESNKLSAEVYRLTGEVAYLSAEVTALERGTSKEAIAKAADAVKLSFPIEIEGDYSCGLALVREGLLYGYVNNKNKYVIPAQYEKAEDFENGYARVVKNEKIGLINTSGKEVLPCVYDDIEVEDIYVLVELNDKYGLFNVDGKEILPCMYDRIRENSVCANGKWGLMNVFKGKEISPLIYDGIRHFRDDIVIVEKDGFFGLVSEKDNSTILPIEYSMIDDYKVCKNNKYGCVDQEGKIIIPTEYDSINGANEKWYVSKNGKYGILDGNGNVLVPTEYDSIEGANEKWYVSKNGIYGILDKNGNVIVPTEYDSVEAANEKWYVSKNGKYGILDGNGNVLVPTEYDEFEYYNGDIKRVRQGNLWGLISIADGSTILEVEYTHIGERDYSGKAVEIRKNEEIGYIDYESGKRLVPTDEDGYGNYKVCVNKNGVDLYGYIDRNGNILIPIEYDQIEDFNGYIKRVRQGDLWGLISIADEIVQRIKYSEIGEVIEISLYWSTYRRARMCLNGKWGYFDEDGNIVIEAQYESATDFYKKESDRAEARVESLEYSCDGSQFVIRTKLIDQSGDTVKIF